MAIQKVQVVGAGQMGSGIARRFVVGMDGEGVSIGKHAKKMGVIRYQNRPVAGKEITHDHPTTHAERSR